MKNSKILITTVFVLVCLLAMSHSIADEEKKLLAKIDTDHKAEMSRIESKIKECGKQIDKIVKNESLDIKIVIALSTTTGDRLARPMLFLGKPSRQDIDEFENSTHVSCRWDLGKGKSFYVSSKGKKNVDPLLGKIDHVSPEGFSLDEISKVKKISKEFDSLTKQQDELKREKEKCLSDYAMQKELVAKFWKEAKQERQWMLANGKKSAFGLIEGVDKNSVLLRNYKSKVSVRVEAVYLCFEDRMTISMYCTVNGLETPEIDPKKKLKAGMNASEITRLLGTPSEQSKDWAKWDNVDGDVVTVRLDKKGKLQSFHVNP